MAIRWWGWLHPRSAEGWYEPERRNLDSLDRRHQELAVAFDEVDGVCAAFDWLRYSAKHCPSTAEAASALRKARDVMADLAVALDQIEGLGDFHDSDLGVS